MGLLLEGMDNAVVMLHRQGDRIEALEKDRASAPSASASPAKKKSKPDSAAPDDDAYTRKMYKDALATRLPDPDTLFNDENLRHLNRQGAKLGTLLDAALTVVRSIGDPATLANQSKEELEGRLKTAGKEIAQGVVGEIVSQSQLLGLGRIARQKGVPHHVLEDAYSGAVESSKYDAKRLAEAIAAAETIQGKVKEEKAEQKAEARKSGSGSGSGRGGAGGSGSGRWSGYNRRF